MRRSRAGAIVVALMTLVSCGGDDGAGAPTDTGVAPVTSQVMPLADPDVASSANDITFCDAFGAVRTDWVDGAVVPLKIWIDAWSTVDDEPPQASKSLAALRAFADQKIAWNFKQIDERPRFDETMARHAVVLADAAVEACPDLPIAVSFDGAGAPPAPWADESPEAIDELCRGFANDVEEAIADYVERNGRQPGHIEQLDADAFVAWAYGDADLFISNDSVGVVIGSDGRAEPAAVPGAGCDR